MIGVESAPAQNCILRPANLCHSGWPGPSPSKENSPCVHAYTSWRFSHDHLHDELYQRLDGPKVHRLPRHNMLHPSPNVVLRHIGFNMNLHDKGAPGRIGGLRG
jgi:hypothetical protein